MLRIEKILSPNKDGFCEQQNNNTVGFRVLALWGPSLSPVLFSKELCDSCKSESHGKSDSRKATTCGKSEFPSLWRSHQSNLALASLWLCIKCVLEKQHNLVFLQRRTISSRLKNSANINPAQQIWQIPLPHGAWSSLTVLIVSCLSLFSCYLYELPQWIIFLHLTPPLLSGHLYFSKWLLHTQHALSRIPTISPLHMSKPSKVHDSIHNSISFDNLSNTTGWNATMMFYTWLQTLAVAPLSWPAPCI